MMRFYHPEVATLDKKHLGTRKQNVFMKLPLPTYKLFSLVQIISHGFTEEIGTFLCIS
jgi:hypothetical protein